MTDNRVYTVNKVQNVSRSCIVCGVFSEASLKTRFYEIETDNGVAVVGVPAVDGRYQSYPNRMHGGIIAALLDETVGRAVQIRDEATWGVTGELTVRYLKPVPIDRQILVLGNITAERSRLFEGAGKIILADTGEVVARATGKFFKLSPGQICEESLLHAEWFADTRPAPKQITIPFWKE